ncbi:2-oxoglutarate dehydrogenase complex dihydrolipoyllysine-residue succinyltransferase [Aneurinibacillus danicus]|uniref:Dihydrolipoyllysine-residue succinyltransferase component of 2-oxoglutarate dehydrogenase complex n=1 Tax=Aneurinibacillus danicus TaxID=267746 RepID=A0A511V6D3_9BACL|nr:2-oxoglutarate dehydrogenase complex dihydrolipoyllysine-residue succinyltransferase [Aneurinibacillus danicus]GEN34495.1 dihydrolipoyllysine-residue succinyltransferase component of 2-oxoglutarate dehydrogenase complex [Aneurinibacillus danicus]
MSEVKVPELAESITEGTIVKWLKAEGDSVSRGEVLAELETDKVNIEISAEEDGKLEKILREPGDTVEVGEVIAMIAQGAGGDTAPSKEETAAPKEQAEPPKEENAPLEKATIPSNEEQDEVEPARSPDKEGAEIHSSRAASPAARRLARERGIDIDSVRSQDPLGRIRVDDVKASGEAQPEVRQEKTAAPAPAGAQKQAERNPQVGAGAKLTGTDKPIERVPMSRRRQTIAERLVYAQQTAAMLTTFNEVDMTAILDVRKRRQEKFVEQHNVKLGFMSFFTKAVIGALKAFPLLNAEIQGTDILIKKYYDIGIAVSTEGGLVVPVVRDADRLSFADLEKNIADLAKKARDNKLSLSDLQGGTFSITNGGIFGSMLSTPILNPPQVGILGMHKIQLRPVAIDTERTENRPMMYIALSYDHRIVDGKEAVSFLARVKELLEDPEALLLEG